MVRSPVLRSFLLLVMHAADSRDNGSADSNVWCDSFGTWQNGESRGVGFMHRQEVHAAFELSNRIPFQQI